MRAAEGSHDILLALGRENRLEAQLGHTLFPSRLAVRRVGPLTAEERSSSLRVPGTALVLPDPSGTGLEQRFAHGTERLTRHEDDELAVQLSVSICAFCSFPL
jgi:hypothetical protein